MLLEKIKADQLSARKAGNKLNAVLLTTLIGEATMIGKNAGNRDTTDEETNKVIVKFIKGIDESLNYIKNGTADSLPDDRIVTLEKEKEVLEKYLPKQLTVDELKAIILKEFTDKPNVGQVMAYLKANYSGLYDGKVASGLINTLY